MLKGPNNLAASKRSREFSRLCRLRRRTAFALSEAQLEHVSDAGGTFRVALRLVVGDLAETDARGRRAWSAPSMTRRLQSCSSCAAETVQCIAVHR
jgi:hypothetical protein